jgi:serine/threonine-protein kinase
MGTVFRAEHVLLGRPAAVKLLRPDLTTRVELVQRFVNEAKAVTASKHPGIVEVYDFGYTPDGRSFIVMELLEGEPLGRRLARVRLGEPEAILFAHGIASALKAAHKVGVIHRDLKPDNVFLVPDPDGGPDRTKVLDFGIAKLAEPTTSGRKHTETGSLIGTPLYMAPEQARAAGTIDHRADLYSLGCILYHMLVGRPPFIADGGGEIIALQMFGQPEPPSRLAAVTPQMERLVLRLLEKEPADRFASAAEVASALAAMHPQLAVSSRASQLEEAPSGSAPRKRSAAWIVAGALTLTAAAGIGLALWLPGHGAPATLEPAPAASVAPVAPSRGTPATEPTVRPPSPPAVATPGPTSPAAPALAPQDTHRLRTTPVAHTRRAAAKAAPAEHPLAASAKAGDPGLPDRASDERSESAGRVLRDVRQSEPPKPGEHTLDGSPMERDVSFGKKPAAPAAAPAAPKARSP